MTNASSEQIQLCFVWPDELLLQVFAERLALSWRASEQPPEVDYRQSQWTPVTWSAQDDHHRLVSQSPCVEVFAAPESLDRQEHQTRNQRLQLPPIRVGADGAFIGIEESNLAAEAGNPADQPWSALRFSAMSRAAEMGGRDLWWWIVGAWKGRALHHEHPVLLETTAPPGWGDSGVRWTTLLQAERRTPQRIVLTVETGPDHDQLTEWMEANLASASDVADFSTTHVRIHTDPTSLVPYAIETHRQTHRFAREPEGWRAFGDLEEHLWRFRVATNEAGTRDAHVGMTRFLDDPQRFHVWFKRAGDPPPVWRHAASLQDGAILDDEGHQHDPAAVTRWVSAYRSGGFMRAFPQSQILPLPEGIECETDGAEEEHRLALEELEEGHHLVRVTFGPSASQPDDPGHYATTLENLTDQAFRVLRFGGYAEREAEDGWHLYNYTGAFFRDREWIDWYAPGTDGWVPPGGTATDPDNWGAGRVLWAYEILLRDGTTFWIGGIIDAGLAQG